jgi:hypothetical protein
VRVLSRADACLQRLSQTRSGIYNIPVQFKEIIRQALTSLDPYIEL